MDDLISYKESRPRSHLIFDLLHGESVSPGVALVEKHLNRGFGMLCIGLEHAEGVLKSKCCLPCTLGALVFLAPVSLFLFFASAFWVFLSWGLVFR